MTFFLPFIYSTCQEFRLMETTVSEFLKGFFLISALAKKNPKNEMAELDKLIKMYLIPKYS